jgi:hypothetical protein
VATWTSDEQIKPDGAVASEQRLLVDRAVVDPTECGALDLGRLYWDTVERYWRPLIFVRRHSDGRVDLRSFVGPSYLRFGTPEVAVGSGEVACRYPIEGGLLARNSGGAITFRQREGENGVTLSSTIEGFHPTLAARPGRPRWTGALYALGESRFHVALSRRYFDRLLRESP